MPQVAAFLAAEAFWGISYGALIAAAVSVVSAAENARKGRSMRRAAIRDYNASLEDRLVMLSTSNGGRSRVYGRVRNTDGILFKGTHGVHSEKYTLVVPLAGHEVDGIETVYFGDQALSLIPDGQPLVGGGASPGYYVDTAPFSKLTRVNKTVPMTVTGGSGSVDLGEIPVAGSVLVSNHQVEADYFVTPSVVGSVVSVAGAPYDATWQVDYQVDVYSSRMRIWKYLGAPGQDISLLLQPRFPSLIAASDKFSGVAALVVEMEFDQDAYPTGVQNVSAVVRGAKVLDPRTGVTTWTENPALIALDWAMFANGGGANADELVAGMFSAAANACDVVTRFTTSDGATETRPLYQCGIVCNLENSPTDTFQDIVDSMAGKWGWSSGRLSLVAGVARPPVLDMDDDWLSDAREIVVVKDAPRTDVVNVYRPTIANADGYVNGATGATSSVAYTSTPAPEVRSSAYIAADGQVLPRSVALNGVTRVVHSQHICGVWLRDARDGLVVQLSCKMPAFVLELFDVVRLSLAHLGFVQKQFEVIGWKFSIDELVTVTLKETGAAIYSPSSGLNILDLQQNTTLPVPWYAGPVTGVTVTSGIPDLQDGWPVPRTLVSWDPSTVEAVRQSGKFEVQYTEVSDAPGLSDFPGVFVDGHTTSVTISGLRAGRAYLFRVRAINTLGARGPWSLQVGHVNADPPPLDTPGLAAGAATEVLQGPLDVAVYAGGFGVTVPGHVQVTPSVNCKMTITVTGVLSAANSSGSTKNVRCFVAAYLVTSSTTDSGDEARFQRQIANGETWEDTPSVTYAIDAVAGVTYTCGMYYSDHVAKTQATTLTNVRTRLELIKR